MASTGQNRESRIFMSLVKVSQSNQLDQVKVVHWELGKAVYWKPKAVHHETYIEKLVGEQENRWEGQEPQAGHNGVQECV